MTPEQIKNWRDILAKSEIGPYAYLMPPEQIEKLRDKLQERIDAISISQKKPHDPHP